MVWRYFTRTVVLGVVLLGVSSGDMWEPGPKLTRVALYVALVACAIQTAVAGIRRIQGYGMR
jgi:hypothetical protein